MGSISHPALVRRSITIAETLRMPEFAGPVCAFLEARDVLRLEVVSRGVYYSLRSNEGFIWLSLLKRDFYCYGVPSDKVDTPHTELTRPLLEDAPRGEYEKRARARAEDLTANRISAMQLQQAVAAQRHQTMLLVISSVMDFTTCGVPLPLLCSFVVLLTLKEVGYLNVPYWTTFMPIFLAVGLVLTGIALGAMLREYCSPRRGKIVETDLYALDALEDERIGGMYSRVKTFYHCYLSPTSYPLLRLLWLVGCALLAVAVAPASILLRLEGAITVPWSLAFVPLYLALAGWLLLPWACGNLMQNTDDEATSLSWNAFTFGSVTAWAPIVAVLGMTAARLDGTYIEAQFLFIPFWVANFLLLMAALWLIFSWISDPTEATAKAYRNLGIALLCVPLYSLPGEIYAAVYDNQYRVIPFAAVSTPFLLTLGLMSVVSLQYVWRRTNFSGTIPLSLRSARATLDLP